MPACDNRVKILRQARGWSQAELAARAGISRTAVSAIEGARLVPSVAAALALARALGDSVESLFGSAAPAEEPVAHFAWQPIAFPCRYWAAEVAGRTLLIPVENGPRGGLPHDGIALGPVVPNPQIAAARTTLLVAGCDPAAGLLAAAYRRQSGLRMLVLTRTSGDALALLEQNLVHVAGIHLGGQRGNAAALGERNLGHALDLLHVASWDEGLACDPALQVRSAGAAARGKWTWIGRSAGAGARRFQDELRGDRPPPRHIARDHRGVVEAIRSGWADLGVCVRLASEEGGLRFLPIAEEPYDLVYRRADAADPRVVALVRAVRTPTYRQLLTELPGYRPQLLGEVEHVPATS
jgi:molybdate-binding protein/transcriptional regulator with XRE-family HTH domain